MTVELRFLSIHFSITMQRFDSVSIIIMYKCKICCLQNLSAELTPYDEDLHAASAVFIEVPDVEMVTLFSIDL